MKKKTLFVTFYSYKGGVGRTLALANVAFQLASEGKRIVLVDFDLEAPGLHKFPFCKSKTKKPGLMEYIFDYVEKKSIPNIKNYLIKPRSSKYKNLTLIKAGNCDEKYREKLARLDWDILYEHYYGFNFFENMKRDIVEACDNPDYVFIDSRTGLTDIGNICTQQLPDIVVILFSLNYQNMDGIKQIYKSIKEFQHPKKREEKIKIIPVASPVPYGEAKLKKDGIQHFKDMFDPEDKNILVLPYHPRLAFTETFILEGDMKEEDIATRIIDLTRRIKNLNPLDTEKYQDKVFQYFKSRDFHGAIKFQKKVAEIKETNASEWNYLGELYNQVNAKNEALDCFKKASKLDPKNIAFLINLAEILCDLKRFDESLSVYDKAIKLDPKDAVLYYNKAIAFSHLKRFNEAITLFDKATSLNPKFTQAYYDKACAFSLLGKRKRQ